MAEDTDTDANTNTSHGDGYYSADEYCQFNTGCRANGTDTAACDAYAGTNRYSAGITEYGPRRADPMTKRRVAAVSTLTALGMCIALYASKHITLRVEFERGYAPNRWGWDR